MKLARRDRGRIFRPREAIRAYEYARAGSRLYRARKRDAGNDCRVNGNNRSGLRAKTSWKREWSLPKDFSRIVQMQKPAGNDPGGHANGEVIGY